MNPKRKLRLILLGWMVPFAALMFYVLKSQQLPKWFLPVEFGYFVAFLTSMTLYVRRHPELRPSPEEKARRAVPLDSVTARRWTSVFLSAGIVVAVIILLQRDPLSHAWGRGVTPNPTLIPVVHGAAWAGLVICIAGFVRLGQVWYRTRKASELEQQRQVFK